MLNSSLFSLFFPSKLGKEFPLYVSFSKLFHSSIHDTEAEKVRVKTEKDRDGESQRRVNVIKGNTREHKVLYENNEQTTSEAVCSFLLLASLVPISHHIRPFQNPLQSCFSPRTQYILNERKLPEIACIPST